MFDIIKDDQDTIHLSGRFDASHAERAKAVFDTLDHSGRVDLADLEYISSAGLGVLLATFRRLQDDGFTLTLVNMRKLVRDVFRFSGLDRVLEIE